MFEEDYIMSLFKDENDNKEKYIKNKIKRRGIGYLNISEVNYLRKKNNLTELSIIKLKDCLYENIISYSDIYKSTNISRPMMSMILRGTRNCTIKQINKILEYFKDNNIKFTF